MHLSASISLRIGIDTKNGIWYNVRMSNQITPKVFDNYPYAFGWAGSAINTMLLNAEMNAKYITSDEEYKIAFNRLLSDLRRHKIEIHDGIVVEEKRNT